MVRAWPWRLAAQAWGLLAANGGCHVVQLAAVRVAGLDGLLDTVEEEDPACRMPGIGQEHRPLPPGHLERLAEAVKPAVEGRYQAGGEMQVAREAAIHALRVRHLLAKDQVGLLPATSREPDTQ